MLTCLTLFGHCETLHSLTDAEADAIILAKEQSGACSDAEGS